MSTLGAILNLGAELVVFISAASLLLVAAARPGLLGAGPGARIALQLAAAMLAVTALVRGALVNFDPGTAGLSASRLTAAVLLGAGALVLDQRGVRRLLLTGAFLFAGGELAYRIDADALGDAVRAVGGVGVGMAAALGARRSIAIRIAAAATALLVVVVLVLSAALSAVLTNNVASEALQRAEERASIEAGITSQQSDEAVGQASFIAEVLAASDPFPRALASGNFEQLATQVEAFRSTYRQVDFIAYVDRRGAARVSAGIDDPTELVELAGSAVVADALAGNDAASVEVVGPGLVSMGATPISLEDDRGVVDLVGAAVTGIRLDEAFLANRLQEQRGTAFALVTSDGVTASTRGSVPGSLAGAVGNDLSGDVIRQVLGEGRPVSAETTIRGDDAFVAVHPVLRSDGQPVAALAVTTDSDIVEDTQTSLFRTLFLVAVLALAFAFAFAVLAGARLAAPVRRLTDAAKRVAEGDLGVRAGIEAEDEIGTLGTTFDSMTDSIEAMTREIREAAAQTTAILGGMAEGLVATDADGVVVALNPAAETMLGTKEARALGRPVDAVIKGRDAGGRPLADRLASSIRRTWSASGVLTGRGGDLAVAMTSSTITGDDGEPIGRVYVMRDIQREAEVEKMKSEFLANISHELRTPLTPIKGYAEMMLSRKVSKTRQELFLANILEGAERLERYVDMLVNFSAMEAGRFELHLDEADPRELVRRVGERWDSSTPSHRVDVVASSRVPRVIVDERLLERAVNELVDNAVKYSPEGGTVTLRARARGSGSARRVEVSVEDRGIGIEQSNLESIFSEFSQLDGSSTRRYGGLGLGLSFVHRVVQEHQGTLDAVSEPGSGSTFTISLPPASRRRGAKGSSRQAASNGRASQRAKQAVTR